MESALATADREMVRLKSQRVKHRCSLLVRRCHYRIFLFCVAPHLISWYGFLILALSAIMEQLNGAFAPPSGLNFLEHIHALPAWIRVVVTHGLRHGAASALATA